jgi:predicted molibdopterin-dependent oxidoreductase YjgC
MIEPPPIWFQGPPPPSRPPIAPKRAAPALVDVVIDGEPAKVAAGATILEACRTRGIDVPTLCFLETLTPVNVCRVCVVEVAGSRVLVPACSRPVEPGMTILTDSERVRLSRRMVLELLASSVDLSTAPGVNDLIARYGARPERHCPPARAAARGERDAREPGHHGAPDGAHAETVAQPVKVDNDLYLRDYSKCILCYKCVEACGVDAQNTFAIPDSACVYCGNCIGVCPTGALMFKREHDMRAAGHWDEARQHTTDTICSYCGVGCTLTLHVQDNRIVKVTSPADSSVTHGHLCIKGRFGFTFVEGPQSGGGGTA